MVKQRSSPFGSRTRTRVLLALQLGGESYARELAPLLEIRLGAVQGALRSLERDGLVGARAAGRTRLYRLEPRYFAARELVAMLQRLAVTEPRLRLRVEALRRRPRRSGKPI